MQLTKFQASTFLWTGHTVYNYTGQYYMLMQIISSMKLKRLQHVWYQPSWD